MASEISTASDSNTTDEVMRFLQTREVVKEVADLFLSYFADCACIRSVPQHLREYFGESAICPAGLHAPSYVLVQHTKAAQLLPDFFAYLQEAGLVYFPEEEKAIADNIVQLSQLWEVSALFPGAVNTQKLHLLGWTPEPPPEVAGELPLSTEVPPITRKRLSEEMTIVDIRATATEIPTIILATDTDERIPVEFEANIASRLRPGLRLSVSLAEVVDGPWVAISARCVPDDSARAEASVRQSV